MSIRLWNKEEDDIIKSKYQQLGTIISKEIGRSPKAIINRAYILGIKRNRTRKVRYCPKCFKQVNAYYKNKEALCRKCVANERYSKRGAFSNNNSKLWSKEDIEFLIINFYDKTKQELQSYLNRKWSSISHKAQRLKLKRNIRFLEEGNSKGRAYFTNNNPMLNPIYKAKALNKQVPIFSRSKKTSIEKKVANFLDKLGIKYEFNKCIKTSNTFRFPDFVINNLIIECDGDYWHKYRKQQDLERENELIELGYEIIRFSDKKINNNFEEVKKCILLKLSQLKN